MIRGVLFDFFGTLVQYSPSRLSQGYEQTHNLLEARNIELSYTSFLERWRAASEELDHWSAEQHQEYSMLDVAKRFLRYIDRGWTGPAESRPLEAGAIVLKWRRLEWNAHCI